MGDHHVDLSHKSNGHFSPNGHRNDNGHFATGNQSENARKTYSGHSTFPSSGSSNGSSNSGLNKLMDPNKNSDEDNVNVVVRVRPPSNADTELADILFLGEGQLQIERGENVKQNKPRHFQFNVAFDDNATQAEVFEHCGIKRLIEMAIDGFSCTVFAYGQTGSGKTHTLSGPPSHPTGSKGHYAAHHPQPHMEGLMPKSFQYLFKILGKKSAVIKTSYMELYNEQAIDLLNPTQKNYLDVRWAKDKTFYVDNLYLVECVEYDDVLAVMEEGIKNRKVSANNVNECSSRSHAILTIHIITEEKDPEDEKASLTKHGKLKFVDLAGSEKITQKGTTQSSIHETNKINRSLLTLGKCISTLGDPKKKKQHIPYRDSKLTKLLKDSIGGNGVTLMVACISSLKSNISETLNTLYYATQTKKIKNRPHIVLDPREHLILCLKRELKVVKAENQYLKEQLHYPKMARNASAPQPAKHLAIVDKLKASLNTGHWPNDCHVKDVYVMVADFISENEALREENTELLRTKESLVHDHEVVSRENESLTKKVESLEKNSYSSSKHSSSSNGSSSTLSDYGGTSTFAHRPPPHLALPVKPPHRLPGVPDSSSKELKKMQIGEKTSNKAKTAKAQQRRNSWDVNMTNKKSHTAGNKLKKAGESVGNGHSNLGKRSESDQHLRKSVEPDQQHRTKNILPKLLGYETPRKQPFKHA